jgi:exosortase/archaeosortase family protein
VADPAVLNARVGRVLPSPLFGTRLGLPAAAPRAKRGARPNWRVRLAQVPCEWWLLALLLAALWPHGLWLARRLTDGSDEPWGLLALATVLVLVLRARRELVMPAHAALLAGGVLAVLAAVATLVVPPMLAAAAAMLSLAAFLASALQRRPAAPLVTLLLLSLPVIASLQFYLGYPLRLATAYAAAPLLALAGVEAQASGAALLWQGRTILVDPPCAGIGMLWVGSWAAALLSYLNDATARRTLANGCVAAAAVFAANALRNALLFFPEAGLVPAPAWLHPAIGLAAFAAALLPVFLFGRGAPCAAPAVPPGRSRAPSRRPGGLFRCTR